MGARGRGRWLCRIYDRYLRRQLAPLEVRDRNRDRSSRRLGSVKRVCGTLSAGQLDAVLSDDVPAKLLVENGGDQVGVFQLQNGSGTVCIGFTDGAAREDKGRL